MSCFKPFAMDAQEAKLVDSTQKDVTEAVSCLSLTLSDFENLIANIISKDVFKARIIGIISAEESETFSAILPDLSTLHIENIY